MSSYPTIHSLLEQATDFDGDEMLTNEIVDLLQQDCGPYIREMAKGPGLCAGLLRGAKVPFNRFGLYRAHAERTAVMMEPERTKLWNDQIKAQGKVANRNDLMTSGDARVVEQFGDTWAVYPKGKFNYTWVPDSYDANFWADSWFGSFLDKRSATSGDSEYNHEEAMKEFAVMYAEKIKEVEVKGDDGSLLEASRTGNEIMVKSASQEFYFLDYKLHVNLWRDIIRRANW